MKAIKLIVLLLISIRCGAQSTYDGPDMVRLKTDTAYARQQSEAWDAFIAEHSPKSKPEISLLSWTESYAPRAIYYGYDSCNFFYTHYQQHSATVSNETVWSAKMNRDTVRFIIPPKHMIIGNNSYTSMFLNGNWYFLMDPTNLK